MFTDSWFTSLTGMLHGRIWGANMGSTISVSRTGLDTKDDPVFKNLMKAMMLKNAQKGTFEEIGKLGGPRITTLLFLQ